MTRLWSELTVYHRKNLACIDLTQISHPRDLVLGGPTDRLFSHRRNLAGFEKEIEFASDLAKARAEVISEQDAHAIGVNYLYFYSPITMDVTRSRAPNPATNLLRIMSRRDVGNGTP